MSEEKEIERFSVMSGKEAGEQLKALASFLQNDRRLTLSNACSICALFLKYAQDSFGIRVGEILKVDETDTDNTAAPLVILKDNEVH